jgi:hypothetical protein
MNKGTKLSRNPLPITAPLYLWVLIGSLVLGCNTSTTNIVGAKTEPRGFLQRLADQLTARECNVGKFICPYGLGPAGEPCECVQPSGVVLKGRTIK